jgi:hypothetical protein
VKLEEYTGDEPAIREVLKYDAKAAELSGVDLVLSHQPENWQGPANSLQSAISSALTDTGRVKPVLVTAGDRLVAGDSFLPQLTAAGTGGIANIFANAKPAVLATKESVEMRFVGPTNSADVVERDIFDLVGKADRAKGRRLSADEVRELTDQSAPELRESIYQFFVATGAVRDSLVATTDAPIDAGGDASIRTLLRHLNVTFAMMSDVVLKKFLGSRASGVVWYPQTPHVHVAELVNGTKTRQLSLDLRRTPVRVVDLYPGPRVFNLRLVRGIVEGTLERVLVSLATTGFGDQSLTAGGSTSVVFEQARASNTPILALPAEKARLDISADVRARLDEDERGGHVSIVPQRAVSIGGSQRIAWWRVDRQTGETIGVTDEGLHQSFAYFTQIRDRLTLVFLTTTGANPRILEIQYTTARAFYAALNNARRMRLKEIPFLPPGPGGSAKVYPFPPK